MCGAFQEIFNVHLIYFDCSYNNWNLLLVNSTCAIQLVTQPRLDYKDYIFVDELDYVFLRQAEKIEDLQGD